jgi:hypothetical protein
VSDQRCPSESELFRFVDTDLSPEQLQRVEQHLPSCSACAKQVAALRLLIDDIAAPHALAEFDVANHAASVMARLDAQERPARRSRFALWGGMLAAAAVLAALLVVQSRPSDSAGEQFAARGTPAEASLPRDVGVHLYVQEQSLRPLEAGSRIRAGAALTAGFRNIGSERAYLLLFAVDARHAVHWIAPEFVTPGSDPEAVLIAPKASEQLLPSAVVFDDLAAGALTVVAIITREPLRVGEIEALSADNLSGERLVKRFPRAEVRQFLLDVAP